MRAKMFRKRLRIFVPAVQVILLISAAVWHNVAWRSLSQHGEPPPYAFTPSSIIAKSNYPLMILWAPIAYLLAWVSSYSFPDFTSGAGVVLALVFYLAILSSVSLFWYFVVVEFEKRSRGASLVRFSDRILETLKAVVLAIAGISSFVYAYWDGHRLLRLGQRNPLLYASSMVDAIIGGLFLVTWGIVLIKISIQDFAGAFRANQKTVSER